MRMQERERERERMAHPHIAMPVQHFAVVLSKVNYFSSQWDAEKDEREVYSLLIVSMAQVANWIKLRANFFLFSFLPSSSCCITSIPFFLFLPSSAFNTTPLDQVEWCKWWPVSTASHWDEMKRMNETLLFLLYWLLVRSKKETAAEYYLQLHLIERLGVDAEREREKTHGMWCALWMFV